MTLPIQKEAPPERPSSDEPKSRREKYKQELIRREEQREQVLAFLRRAVHCFSSPAIATALRRFFDIVLTEYVFTPKCRNNFSDQTNNPMLLVF